MKSLVFTALLWALISFYLYWPLFFSILKKGKRKNIVLVRFYGGLLFGGVPVLILLILKINVLDNLGLHIPEGPIFWHLLSAFMIIAIIPLIYYQARSSSNLSDYPQIKSPQWNLNLILMNSASWIFYLIGYEVLFRGFLLFPLFDELSLGLVLIINLSIYSLSHVAKSFREGLGTIPIGLLLFVIAWKTNSILYPIIIHWTIALSNSFFSVRHHPEMEFVKRRKA